MNTNRSQPDWALLLTVFITGACVLVIELIGTRILAPFFGSGIYTWSALISITLAALALGYSVGGHLADRTPKSALLYALVLVAGAWTVLTPLFAHLLLPRLVHIDDMRLGVLLSGSLLFFPNLFLLGAIGPFAIRLITRQQAVVGAKSGLVFAVSTLGSLLAAIGTGFILIPNVGVQAIFTWTGAVLLALAVIGNFRPRFVSMALLLSALTAALALYGSQPRAAQGSIEVLDYTPSFYGNLHVIRKDDQKSLLADGIGQNYVQEGGGWVTPYLNFLSAVPGMRGLPRDRSKTGLVIGLGAGQLPMLLEQEGLQVTAVEIDPKVGLLAARHFGFSLPPERVHYLDGRMYLARSTQQFDYIVLDAFTGEQVAWHLTSREALAAARERLQPGGVLGINFTSNRHSADAMALQHTLQQVFPHVRTFALDYGHGLESIEFLASDSPLNLHANGILLGWQRQADVQRFLAGEQPDLGSTLVLTDDYNPVNEQRREIQLLWRNAMLAYFGNASLDWLLF